MRNSTKVRAAILTSIGLLPLACMTGRTAERDDSATRVGDADDQRAEQHDRQPDVKDTTLPDDHPSPVTHGPLLSCGQDSVVLAETLESLDVTNSIPVITNGIDTGLMRCESGLLHRPEPVTCASHLPRPLPPGAGIDAADGGVASGESNDVPTQVAFLYPDEVRVRASCAEDADCTEKPLGYCAPAYFGGNGAYDIACQYGCLTDDDCGSGYLCQCGDPVGRCVQATCRSDADCGDEFKCAAWFTPKVCSAGQFFTCQTPDDECTTGAECTAGHCMGDSGQRKCVEVPHPACGRPFLVAGQPRVAETTGRGGWSEGDGSTGDERAGSPGERVGAYWLGAALLEHASVAAFARFTLQLMHLGAPRELIEASQRAMLDETEHAKACFALARRYFGRVVEPGRLPMDRALEELELDDIALMAFREGCVGETVATLEALHAHERATDRAVRDVLSRIGRDELTHAELAWRFVQWAIAQTGPGLLRKLAGEVLQLEREAALGLVLGDLDAVPEHGVLSSQDRHWLRRQALTDVVLPCARQLLRNAQQGHEQSAAARSAAALRRCPS